MSLQESQSLRSPQPGVLPPASQPKEKIWVMKRQMFIAASQNNRKYFTFYINTLADTYQTQTFHHALPFYWGPCVHTEQVNEDSHSTCTSVHRSQTV